MPSQFDIAGRTGLFQEMADRFKNAAEEGVDPAKVVKIKAIAKAEMKAEMEAEDEWRIGEIVLRLTNPELPFAAEARQDLATFYGKYEGLYQKLVAEANVFSGGGQ